MAAAAAEAAVLAITTARRASYPAQRPTRTSHVNMPTAQPRGLDSGNYKREYQYAQLWCNDTTIQRLLRGHGAYSVKGLEVVVWKEAELLVAGCRKRTGRTLGKLFLIHGKARSLAIRMPQGTMLQIRLACR